MLIAAHFEARQGWHLPDLPRSDLQQRAIALQPGGHERMIAVLPGENNIPERKSKSGRRTNTWATAHQKQTRRKIRKSRTRPTLRIRRSNRRRPPGSPLRSNPLGSLLRLNLRRGRRQRRLSRWQAVEFHGVAASRLCAFALSLAPSLESRGNRFRLREGQPITRSLLRIANVKPVAHHYRMVPRLAFQRFEGGCFAVLAWICPQ